MALPSWRIRLCVLAALSASVAACSVTSGRETAGEYVDDATISTRIRADIVKDSQLKLSQIHVETFQGVVELSGFVDSLQTRGRAESLIRQVPGVRSVQDHLIVR